MYFWCRAAPPNLTLTGLEPGFLLVDHIDLAATTHNLGARLVLSDRSDLRTFIGRSFLD